MNTEVLICIITQICGLVGIVITVIASNKKAAKQAAEQSQLTMYRIQQLEHKQDIHNGIIERMYKAEDKINIQEEKIKVANKRIDDLEKAAAITH